MEAVLVPALLAARLVEALAADAGDAAASRAAA